MSILVAVALIAGGFLLILAEVLLLPGLVTGMIGAGLIVWGIIHSFRHFGPTGAWISVAGSLLTGAVLLYVLIRMKVWQRFVLQEKQPAGEAGALSDVSLSACMGKQGVAITPLHPAGKIGIDDLRYDAVTQGKFLEKGTRVEVIGCSGAQLLVKGENQ